MLDRPLIDFSATPEEEDNPLLKAFKELVANDYPMAEALYAGGVFAVLLFFSQRGVSLYKHCYFQPDSMCPWGDFPATGGIDPLSFL